MKAISATNPLRLGVFGGTFDPVHWGHIALAQAAQQQLALDKVLWIPNQQPVHKQQTQADAQQRLQWLEQVVAQNSQWLVDNREITRTSPSFMVETLASLAAEFPQGELWLLMGADAWNQFDTWKSPQQILQLANIAVVPRHGVPLKTGLKPLEDHQAWWKNGPKTGEKRLLNMTPLGHSSTQIRQGQWQDTPVLPADLQKIYQLNH